MRFDSLIDALQEALQQDLDLVRALTPEQYRAGGSGHFKSSVGMHLRHNLDHFEAFFAGFEDGQIDYESRSRNTQLEDIPGVAEDAIVGYLEQLQQMRALDDRTLNIREESEAGVEARSWLPSSIGREFQFLLGHTVHHNALIVMILDGQGVDLPEGFGVAPSTQRHNRKQISTAN